MLILKSSTTFYSKATRAIYQRKSLVNGDLPEDQRIHGPKMTVLFSFLYSRPEAGRLNPGLEIANGGVAFRSLRARRPASLLRYVNGKKGK